MAIMRSFFLPVFPVDEYSCIYICTILIASKGTLTLDVSLRFIMPLWEQELRPRDMKISGTAKKVGG